MKKNYRFLLVQMCVAAVMFAVVGFHVSYCQAAQWERVAHNDTRIVEIDASSVEWVEYPELGRNLVCWYKYIEKDKTSKAYHCAFRENNGTTEYAAFEKITFDSEGNQISHEGNSIPASSVYRPLIKNSDGERLFEIAQKYAK